MPASSSAAARPRTVPTICPCPLCAGTITERRSRTPAASHSWSDRTSSDIEMLPRREPIAQSRDDFRERGFEVVAISPFGIVSHELPDIANPPDMIADPVGILIGPFERPAGQALAQCNRLHDGAIRMASSAHIVHRARPGFLHEMPERADKIIRMNVVAHLLALVTEHLIGLAGN